MSSEKRVICFFKNALNKEKKKKKENAKNNNLQFSGLSVNPLSPPPSHGIKVIINIILIFTHCSMYLGLHSLNYIHNIYNQGGGVTFPGGV